jgi:hypothetical protein
LLWSMCSVCTLRRCISMLHTHDEHAVNPSSFAIQTKSICSLIHLILSSIVGIHTLRMHILTWTLVVIILCHGYRQMSVISTWNLQLNGFHEHIKLCFMNLQMNKNLLNLKEISLSSPNLALFSKRLI